MVNGLLLDQFMEGFLMTLFQTSHKWFIFMYIYIYIKPQNKKINFYVKIIDTIVLNETIKWVINQTMVKLISNFFLQSKFNQNAHNLSRL
jgi:hypothetical protein